MFIAYCLNSSVLDVPALDARRFLHFSSVFTLNLSSTSLNTRWFCDITTNLIKFYVSPGNLKRPGAI